MTVHEVSRAHLLLCALKDIPNIIDCRFCQLKCCYANPSICVINVRCGMLVVLI